MKINFNDIPETNSFDPIPEGDYEVLVTGAQFKQSKTNKTMLVITYSVQDEDYGNRKLWQNMVIAPNSLWKIKETLVGLGFEPEGDFDLDPDELLGCDGIAEVIVEKSYRSDDLVNSIKRIKAVIVP